MLTFNYSVLSVLGAQIMFAVKRPLLVRMRGPLRDSRVARWRVFRRCLRCIYKHCANVKYVDIMNAKFALS